MQRNGMPLKYPPIPISWAVEMGKGGVRRKSIPEASFDQIYQVLDLQIHQMGIKKGVFFGIYSCLSKTNAADGRGLASNQEMLTNLLRIAPACELPVSLLSKVFKQLLLRWPGLNNGPYPDDLFAGQKADQITTMLFHLRRIVNDNKKEQELRNKSSEEDFESVAKMIALISRTPILPSDVGTDSQSQVAGSTVAYPEDTQQAEDVFAEEESQQVDGGSQCSKVRKLKVEVSEVSVDDEGYPKMLDNPIQCTSSVKDVAIDGAPAGGNKQDGGEQDREIDQDLLLEAIMCKNYEALPKNTPIYVTKTNKQTTLQEEKVPKPKAKKAKQQAEAPTPAKASTPASSSSASPSKLRLVKGTQQSYIQVLNSKEEGWVLLVSLSATMALRHGKDHQQVMMGIHSEVMRRQIVSKPEIVALRDMMLNDQEEDLE